MGEPKGDASIGVESPRVRPPDLATRVALRPKEAAEALGISEGTLWKLLPEVPHVKLRGRVVVPVKPLERWLEEQAREKTSRANQLAQGILEEFGRSE